MLATTWPQFMPRSLPGFLKFSQTPAEMQLTLTLNSGFGPLTWMAFSSSCPSMHFSQTSALSSEPSYLNSALRLFSFFLTGVPQKLQILPRETSTGLATSSRSFSPLSRALSFFRQSGQTMLIFSAPSSSVPLQ